MPAPRVVATYRLPWHFKVGRREVGQAIPAASACGTMPPRNGPGNSSGQQLMTEDTATPGLSGRATPRLLPQEPTIQSPPTSSSLSEGEPQAVSLPVSSPTPARRPGANVVAGRKRPLNEADLDDGDSQSTPARRVRPRPNQGNNANAGPSAPVANDSRSGPFTTAAKTGTVQRPTPHGIPSLNGSSTSPPMTATPSTAQPDASNTELGLSTPRLQENNSYSPPIESNTAVLRATNPRTGPVSGNIEIWLQGEGLPTAFTLYARFGTNVTETVSLLFIYARLLILVLDGSECDFAVLYASLHKSCWPCQGHTIMFTPSRCS